MSRAAAAIADPGRRRRRAAPAAPRWLDGLLSLVTITLGDDAGAKQAYEKALPLEADTQSAHLNLATLHLRASELEQAARHVELARRLDERNPQLARLLEVLRAAEAEAGLER